MRTDIINFIRNNGGVFNRTPEYKIVDEFRSSVVSYNQVIKTILDLQKDGLIEDVTYYENGGRMIQCWSCAI